MKTQNKLAVSMLLAGGMGLGAYTAPASAVALASPLYTQCPAIGSSPGCSVLFTFNASGGISTAIDSGVGPYDGLDDVLVGIQNNSGGTVNSIGLTGSGNGGGIFAFDGDGLAVYTGTSYGPTGYEGPNTSFSNITTKAVFKDTGLVNFLSGGLADGGSLYFSLESSPNGLNITPVPPGGGGGGGGGGGTAVAEPGNLGLLGLGLTLLGFGARARKRSMFSQ